MLHKHVYYLKKLSKKTPPGCSKLENIGYGKQVIQEEHSPAKINRPSMSDNHSEPSNVRLDNQCSSNTPHPSSDKPPTQTTKDDSMSPCAQESSCIDSVLQEEAEPSTTSHRNVPLLHLMGENLLA